MLPEALRDALGKVIATERRQWQRERELIEAQSRATIAELRATIVDLRSEVLRMVEERLASLKDGRDGVDGAPGRDGQDGAAGPQGERGEPGRDGVDGAPGRDGQDGAAGPQGERGEPGRDGADGRDGSPGKFPLVRAWSEAVHYEGDVVVHGGATYQAERDTGRAPPHEDWRCIAFAGRDGAPGASLRICSTWDPDENYQALDVVVLNGASFAARRDNPGACPGEGWQLIAAQGKRGDRGPPGAEGKPGPSGQPVVATEIDDEGMLTLTNGDGSTVSCDLYHVLYRVAR